MFVDSLGLSALLSGSCPAALSMMDRELKGEIPRRKRRFLFSYFLENLEALVKLAVYEASGFVIPP